MGNLSAKLDLELFEDTIEHILKKIIENEAAPLHYVLSGGRHLDQHRTSPENLSVGLHDKKTCLLCISFCGGHRPAG